MKKLIVVIMALITIFSASVSAFAATYVDWEIVDYFTNLSYSNYNCSLVFKNTAKPTPNMFNVSGVIGTQETTYNVLLAMYETVTVEGASFQANAALGGVFEWYEYGGYCWIKYDLDNSTQTMWVGNYQGKILYCDAPASETTYTISAIAGATGYCLTDRPAGTTGSGYLGDLLVTQDNLTTIHGVVDGLGSDADFYMVLRIVDGEYRYYIMCTYPNRTQYFVCNTSGQLYYALRDEVTDSGSTDSGSTFDATEVITAINSVYDAVNSMSSNLGSRLATLINSTNGIASIVETLSINMVTGFTGVQEQLSILNSYFSELSGLFPVQETITLLGSDTRVAWDSADRITGVKTSGFNGDLIVKERAGDLVDESGYEKVSLSSADTEYKLTTDDSGYRRITAQNEYPDTGTTPPDGTLFYFPFDDSLDPSVGDFSFNSSDGSENYSTGVSNSAFVFNGSNYLQSSKWLSSAVSDSKFTCSFWFYPTSYPNGGIYCFYLGSGSYVRVLVTSTGALNYCVFTNASISSTFVGGSLNLNEWNHIAVCWDGTSIYCFSNGNLDGTAAYSYFANVSGAAYLGYGMSSEYISAGSKIDELIFIGGQCLWTSSFDAEKEAIFGEIAKDYFLPCTSQSMTLIFDDTLSKTLTPIDVNGNTIIMGRLEDDFSEIYMDISTMQWYCHDPQTQTEILLSSVNQQIMNDTIYVRQNYTTVPADRITADTLQNLLPVDAPVYLDMPEGASLVITYDHYSGWFRMMYMLMDKQTKLLSDLDIVNETIINVENTVIDITNSNPAYNVFYITKIDGSTESVGETATDAAVIIGDMLSMFYRLVFDDALDNVGILEEFEGVYSTTDSGVNVW